MASCLEGTDEALMQAASPPHLLYNIDRARRSVVLDTTISQLDYARNNEDFGGCRLFTDQMKRDQVGTPFVSQFQRWSGCHDLLGE